jgi:6-phosphogluconolactonase/glucosamine-6-phosphate isomerase/deaminase
MPIAKKCDVESISIFNEDKTCIPKSDPGAYAPYIKKSIFLSVKKFQQFFLHVYLHNQCVFLKFREKPTFRVVGVKKTKHVS